MHTAESGQGGAEDVGEYKSSSDCCLLLETAVSLCIHDLEVEVTESTLPDQVTESTLPDQKYTTSWIKCQKTVFTHYANVIALSMM